MPPESHARFTGSQDAAAMQASLDATRMALSTPAAGSAETRKAVVEESSMTAADAAARAAFPSAKHSLQQAPVGAIGADIQQDGNCNASSAERECNKDSPSQYRLGIQQLALQSVLLLVSWVFLAFLQPNGHPLLLLMAIAFSRLHLGWLLGCILRMLLSRFSSKGASEGPKESDKSRLSAFFGHLRDRCWSRLPLRYWHCAFYLLLLLVAFWAASVVWEDSQEGLQPLQGEGGTPLPSTQAWMGGGLPPLLLNSDSPQHVKIAATAVARGREASDQLLWLLHSAAQQQFGRMLLWLRALTFWLNSFLLQPFVALLRHAGLLASVNGTCSLSDAPEAKADSGASQEGWLLWLQAAVQSAVRNLPGAAHTFLCGDRTSAGLTKEGEAAVWFKAAPEAPLDFGVEGSVVEMGPYCLALLLLLVYSLSAALHRVCLAGYAAFRHLLLAWEVGQGDSLARPWDESLTVACKSSMTAFAVTFVLLALLWSAAALTARGVVLVGSIWGHLFGRTPAGPAGNSPSKAADYSSKGRSTRIEKRCRLGSAGLEILVACVTCWVLLLADREFVMFTWTTLQPLRLSVLSTVLLLRLPSSQVATLLTWPPPLREPALVLQRSQPLRIIDPVAVGSMLGCIVAAAVLGLVLRLLAKLGSYFRRPFTSSCTSQAARSSLGLPRVSRGQWGVRSSPSGGSDSPAPNTLWEKLQEQNQIIAELQASLKRERGKATLTEELNAKLKEEARAQTLAVKASPDGHTDTSSHILPDKQPQADSGQRSAVPDERCRGQVQSSQQQDQAQEQEQQKHSEQQPKQEEAQQQKESGCLAEDAQLQGPGTVQQQTSVFAEQLQEARLRLEELETQLHGAQNKLSELQQKRESEALASKRRQQELEAEAALWRGKEGEVRAENERLKAELAEAARSLEGIRQAQREQQQQACAAQEEDRAQIQRMTQLLQKQTEDLANKIAEINELREKLTQVASTYPRGATRMVDSHSQRPLLQQERLLEQTAGPTLNEVAMEFLSKVDDITHRIKQNVENDTKTVNLHKSHLSSLISRASPKLSHVSNAAPRGQASQDTEPQPNQSSRDTALSGDDQPLLEDPSSVYPSPRTSSAASRRPERKEVLLKEESRKLEEALQTISKCIFPLRTVLEQLELPQATLDAARRVLAATKHYTGDSARLQETLARPSKCTWKGDVEALATVLAVLGRAWPSKESCERLLQREGDAHTLSPVEQKASSWIQ
ncbi:hypothetical protein EPH_0008270 [Eimeria praecox]|uniref:Uncharacterized protein n=1 Tax=Eimeria praecox TaxID=51316 RepID=U6GKE0_9EIME|nr:hypothetical protein EPH_0008270 [Eimeria praecox]